MKLSLSGKPRLKLQDKYIKSSWVLKNQQIVDKFLNSKIYNHTECARVVTIESCFVILRQEIFNKYLPWPRHCSQWSDAISNILECYQNRTFTEVPQKIVLNVPDKNVRQKSCVLKFRSTMLTVAQELASMETKHCSKPSNHWLVFLSMF